VQVVLRVAWVLQTRAAAVVAVVVVQMVARVVLALSFFATPVQFNILLVAQ
jgi:hypothetical protein